MSKLFKLESKKFVDKEWRWTYSCLFKFTFNNCQISEITITDHYQLEHKAVINDELILNILKEELNNKRFYPTDYSGLKKVFRRDGILYQGKKYRLIFWFKDNTTNHLWIRNCYPID